MVSLTWYPSQKKNFKKIYGAHMSAAHFFLSFFFSFLSSLFGQAPARRGGGGRSGGQQKFSANIKNDKSCLKLFL
jgi:hypothetical protein